ncbi:MAG: ATP-dependent Clp protease ATP-binding subunit [Clostridia bacterium]|nr:ATP-dependent Clp protease ATP-binding subunit [Clostridia bacterium]
MYNLTDLANKCIQVSSQFASHYTNQVGTEHILYGLSKVDSKARRLLNAYKVTSDVVKDILENIGSKGIPSNVVELTPRVKELLAISNSVAKKTNSAYISPEHMLVALLSQDDSFAIKILSGALRLNVLDMRNRAIGLIANGNSNQNQGGFNTDGFVQVGNLNKDKKPQRQENFTSELSPELLEMGSDLTLRARNGKIDPIIGRDEEIERMIEILCRKTKNNPVLIGEAGVGKTAVVEGLARRIVSGDVPQFLKNKTIFSLDIGGLMAGTKYRGSMEEKLKNAIETITSNNNIIVFIDEIHTLAQVGSEKGEANPADMLKPYLARGEMQTIGATTTDEYRKYIEKDKALERRFQPILVDQPTVEQTIEILKGLRDSYEAFHKVKITDEAIKAAANLSDRYIQDRSLPDKAIDLVDEASSRAKVKTNYETSEIKAMKLKLEKLEAEKEDAVTQEDFEKASKLRDQVAQIKEEIARQSTLPGNAKDNVAIITEHEIAEVISKWTNIPLTKLTEGEAEKLLGLEKTLIERVKGQDEAIEKVSKAIRRSRIGIRDPKRPIGSFLFLGPTGVGKTELSKALAESLFDDEDKIIRLDMSEFMEAHSVSKLIGSPPGYVGFDDGGQLTEQVRRKPYSVVLFDEIEKAHPEVFNMLLQILDDGRLTDSHGKIVSFKNTIIILTSNIGSEKLYKTKVGLGFNDGHVEDKDDKSSIMLDELKKYFKPELINRIDNIVVFNKLSAPVLKEIAKKMLLDLNKNLKQSGVELKFTAATLNYLVKNGTNDDFGARPMRRLITSKIEDELADRMLKGEIKSGDSVVVDCKESKLVFMTKKE